MEDFYDHEFFLICKMLTIVTVKVAEWLRMFLIHCECISRVLTTFPPFWWLPSRLLVHFNRTEVFLPSACNLARDDVRNESVQKRSESGWRIIDRERKKSGRKRGTCYPRRKEEEGEREEEGNQKSRFSGQMQKSRRSRNSKVSSLIGMYVVKVNGSCVLFCKSKLFSCNT